MNQPTVPPFVTVYVWLPGSLFRQFLWLNASVAERHGLKHGDTIVSEAQFLDVLADNLSTNMAICSHKIREQQQPTDN
jgi:hypothetical protein